MIDTQLFRFIRSNVTVYLTGISLKNRTIYKQLLTINVTRINQKLISKPVFLRNVQIDKGSNYASATILA